jgi:hypothetical protein
VNAVALAIALAIWLALLALSGFGIFWSFDGILSAVKQTFADFSRFPDP